MNVTKLPALSAVIRQLTSYIVYISSSFFSLPPSLSPSLPPSSSLPSSLSPFKLYCRHPPPPGETTFDFVCSKIIKSVLRAFPAHHVAALSWIRTHPGHSDRWNKLNTLSMQRCQISCSGKEKRIFFGANLVIYPDFSSFSNNLLFKIHSTFPIKTGYRMHGMHKIQNDNENVHIVREGFLCSSRRISFLVIVELGTSDYGVRLTR